MKKNQKKQRPNQKKKRVSGGTVGRAYRAKNAEIAAQRYQLPSSLDEFFEMAAKRVGSK